MKIFLKKYIEANEYYKQNRQMSQTAVGEKFNIDRHALSKNFNEYYNAAYVFFKEETQEYWCFSEKEWEAIQKYKNKEKTIKQIQQEYQIPHSTFSRWIKMLNLSHGNAYHTLNENCFDQISTEEQAYWLGFLLEDGYNNEERGSLKVSLGAKDYNHLLKLKQFLQTDVEIKDTVGGSGQLTYTLTVNRKSLSQTLTKYGIIQGKSGMEQFSELIPISLYPHYIRGIIDGDGCLTAGKQYQVDLVGSLSLVTRVLTILSTITPIDLNKHIYQHGTIWRFSLRGKKNIYDCLQYLYGNASIYLDRKYATAMRAMAVLKSEKKSGTPEQGQSEVKA